MELKSNADDKKEDAEIKPKDMVEPKTLLESYSPSAFIDDSALEPARFGE